MKNIKSYIKSLSTFDHTTTSTESQQHDMDSIYQLHKVALDQVYSLNAPHDG